MTFKAAERLRFEVEESHHFLMFELLNRKVLYESGGNASRAERAKVHFFTVESAKQNPRTTQRRARVSQRAGDECAWFDFGEETRPSASGCFQTSFTNPTRISKRMGSSIGRCVSSPAGGDCFCLPLLAAPPFSPPLAALFCSALAVGFCSAFSFDSRD